MIKSGLDVPTRNLAFEIASDKSKEALVIGPVGLDFRPAKLIQYQQGAGSAGEEAGSSEQTANEETAGRTGERSLDEGEMGRRRGRVLVSWSGETDLALLTTSSAPAATDTEIYNHEKKEVHREEEAFLYQVPQPPGALRKVRLYSLPKGTYSLFMEAKEAAPVDVRFRCYFGKRSALQSEGPDKPLNPLGAYVNFVATKDGFKVSCSQ